MFGLCLDSVLVAGLGLAVALGLSLTERNPTLAYLSVAFAGVSNTLTDRAFSLLRCERVPGV